MNDIDWVENQITDIHDRLNDLEAQIMRLTKILLIDNNPPTTNKINEIYGDQYI